MFGFLPFSTAITGSEGTTNVAEMAPTVTRLVKPDMLIAPAPYQEFGASDESHPELGWLFLYIVQRAPPCPCLKFRVSVA